MTHLQWITPDIHSTLVGLADRADGELRWPSEIMNLLRETGVLAWAIPPEFGGRGLSPTELLAANQEIASACMTTAFILSQREGAIRRVLASGRREIAEALLPPLAIGKIFATIGISQLTTSRQHGGPVFKAREVEGGYLLEGALPWVTGAAMAHLVVVGAVLENDQQILVVMPPGEKGVETGRPMELLALLGSLTTEVHCQQVFVERKWLLAGPSEQVMKGAAGGAGGWQTTNLALGLARSALDYLAAEARARPGLGAGSQRLRDQWEILNRELMAQAETEAGPESSMPLRAKANVLVLQATQAALIASKGTGFVRPHPAQRWVRQALFFLVWSCPWAAASATMDFLTLQPDQECQF